MNRKVLLRPSIELRALMTGRRQSIRWYAWAVLWSVGKVAVVGCCLLLTILCCGVSWVCKEINATEFYLDVICPSWWGRICIECWSIREPLKWRKDDFPAADFAWFHILLPFEFPGADDGWSAELGQETDGCLKDFGFDMSLSVGRVDPKQGSDKSQTSRFFWNSHLWDLAYPGTRTVFGALVQGRTANARSEKMVRTDPEWDSNEELPRVIGHRVAMCWTATDIDIAFD